MLHPRLERSPDTTVKDIIYYGSTPAVRAVRRQSDGAVGNELLTAGLVRPSISTRQQLPDRPPPRWPSTSARAPRGPGFGRYGRRCGTLRRGGTRCPARTCSEAVPNPVDWACCMLPSCAPASEGEWDVGEHPTAHPLSCSLCSACCSQVGCQVLEQLHLPWSSDRVRAVRAAVGLPQQRSACSSMGGRAVVGRGMEA